MTWGVWLQQIVWFLSYIKQVSLRTWSSRGQQLARLEAQGAAVLVLDMRDNFKAHGIFLFIAIQVPS